MIIDNKAQTFESNMQPNKSMSFGISDVGLVMEVLSTLYKHSVRTLVQEYICNGRDAMREAGTWGKKPIKIGIPNNFDTNFKVRDYGVGISPDRMANIFVNYGSSTKRDTNTQTGGFGIGAKSAFSYTDSFTVASFYNGKKYTYLCYMTREKGGCDLISTEETSEANGVQIVIAVKRESIQEFKDAVQRCVKYWAEDITFEGVTAGEIKQLKPEASIGQMSVYKDFTQRRGYGYTDDESHIYLIDGIQYNVLSIGNGYDYNNSRFNISSYEYVTTISLPNGVFKLSPSRENILDTEANKELQKVTRIQLDNLVAQKCVEINRIPLLKDKLKEKQLYSGFTRINNISLDLGSGFEIYKDIFTSKNIKLERRWTRRKRRSGEYIVEQDAYHSFSINDTILVKTDKDLDTGSLARRLNHYLLSNTNNGGTKLLITSVDLPYADEIFKTIIRSETLAKPPIVKAKQRVVSGEAVCYNVVNGNRHQVKLKKLNAFAGVVVEWEQGMDNSLSNFYEVYEIPKCNKSGVTKKLLTVAEANAKLLAKRSSAIGTTMQNADKIDALSKYNHKRDLSLYNYLSKLDKTIEAEQNKIEEHQNKLKAKCDLFEVLDTLQGGYQSEAKNIVIAHINKQLGSKA